MLCLHAFTDGVT